MTQSWSLDRERISSKGELLIAILVDSRRLKRRHRHFGLLKCEYRGEVLNKNIEKSRIYQKSLIEFRSRVFKHRKILVLSK
ncbi:hypothetical protein TSAR_002832, partial [Trichomalopsis sarcophagae]